VTAFERKSFSVAMGGRKPDDCQHGWINERGRCVFCGADGHRGAAPQTILDNDVLARVIVGELQRSPRGVSLPRLAKDLGALATNGRIHRILRALVDYGAAERSFGPAGVTTLPTGTAVDGPERRVYRRRWRGEFDFADFADFIDRRWQAKAR